MAGNYKLIGTDQAITLYVPGAFDGSFDPSTNPNAAVPEGGKSLQGIAKHIGIKRSVEMTNVKGIGQALKANRYHSKGGTLDLDMFVTADNGEELTFGNIGYYVYVQHSPLSSMETPYCYGGVLTEWDYDGTEGSEQSLKLTIDLTPDYLPAGD